MAEPKQLKAIKGGLNIAKRLLADGEESGLTAAQRAEAGRKAAELIKSQPQVKASEALGQLMEKGIKRTTTTQADRTRVGGGNIGGAPFSAISEADPAYAGKVWGVMDEGTANRIKNLTDDETAWTTMLGSASQLKTNPIVFDKLKRGFVASMKQGNLSNELASKINHNLALTFGEGADIRDPKIWRQADTFEKRAALADVMMGQGIAPSKGGLALGGEKSGKGVIFKPTDILKRETEPSLLHTEHGGDVPTFAAGPRLFRIEKESEYRPDLHPGFPTLLKGEDYGINMKPTPTEVYLPNWHKKFKKDNPDRKSPGYYDLALGVKGEGLPSQDLNDEYIRHLLREGFKKGGEVDIDAADARLAKAIEERMSGSGMAKGGSVDLDAADARLEAAINARMGMAEGGEVGFKKIQFMAGGGKLVKGLGKIGKRLMADPAESSVTSARRGERMAEEGGGNTIIKDLGGNWRGGSKSVENRLSPLKESSSLDKPKEIRGNPQKVYEDKIASIDSVIERMKGAGQWDANAEAQYANLKKQALENYAIDKWIDSNLGNYMKKQMGTESDPIRKLADEGVTHYADMGAMRTDLNSGYNQYARNKTIRKKLGMPENPLAETNLGKTWEEGVDDIIGSETQLLSKYGTEARRKKEPWMNDLPENTPFYGIPGRGNNPNLGFDHIVDVLREDIRSGRINPNQLNKVSIKQAVERTSQYNADMGKKMAETKLQQQGGFPVHKEYPEGYQWLELSLPQEQILPSGYSIVKNKGSNLDSDDAYLLKDGAGKVIGFGGSEAEIVRSLSLTNDSAGYKKLREALDYEGQAMGHCVGSYCDEVSGGNTKIYSLRDKRGEPHVTIEVNKGYDAPSFYESNKALFEDPRFKDAQDMWNDAADTPEQYVNELTKLFKQAGLKEGKDYTVPMVPKANINQIKGKQNRAPNDEYLPYVQDFVRSGDWDEIGDLRNTGLKTLNEAFPDYMMLKNFNRANPDKKYVSQKEIDDFTKEWSSPQTPPEGMAAGGPAFKKLQFMADGGKLVKGVSKIGKKLMADNSLPALEREVNLQRFLAKSQIKDPVFHASKADVKQFSPKHRTGVSSMGHHFGTVEQANFRTGQYDFDSQTPNIGKYHLNIENPLEVSHMASFAPDHLAEQLMDMNLLKPETYDALSAKHNYDNIALGDELVKVLRKNGYDGLKYANEREGEGFSYVPLNPTQIKSAIGNRGTYDINEPEITKAEGGGAFKTIQWQKPQNFDGGGIASPEEVTPFGGSRREPLLTEKDWENIKRNAPEVYEWAKQNIKDEASQLKSARGVRDFALRTGAQYLGGIPDLVNLGLMGVDALANTSLSSEKPWFGSEQYIDALKRSGAIGENEFPIAETVAGVLAPAGLIRKGVKKVRNVRSKEEPKKRRGGLTAMSR